MVLENTTPEFSIERLESVMLSQNVTWKQINDELEYDVESVLKNTKRQPMLNVINKVCSVIGMKNSDYVMMKSTYYKIVDNNPAIEKYQSDEKTIIIASSIIDSEILGLYIKESDWNYQTISSLMSSKSVFKFSGYLNKTSYININDLDTLCWALVIKKNDISNVNLTDGTTVPTRKVFDRHRYIINSALINELSKHMDDICKAAHIPTWFVYQSGDIYISLEMAEILKEAINKVTDRNITLDELCTNYDGITANKRQYTTAVKPLPTQSIQESIITTCNAIINAVYNKTVPVFAVGDIISSSENFILENDKYYYLRRDDLKYLIKDTEVKNINTIPMVHRLIDAKIANNFKEGSRIVPTRKLTNYGGTRFIEIDKKMLLKTSNIPEAKLLLEQPIEKEEDDNNGTKEPSRFQKTFNNRYNSRYRYSNSVNTNSNKCLDVFSIVDHLSNSELDKVIEYIDTIKKLREIRNSVK